MTCACCALTGNSQNSPCPPRESRLVSHVHAQQPLPPGQPAEPGLACSSCVLCVRLCECVNGGRGVNGGWWRVFAFGVAADDMQAVELREPGGSPKNPGHDVTMFD